MKRYLQAALVLTPCFFFISSASAASYPATCPAEAQGIVAAVGGCQAIDCGQYGAICAKCCVAKPAITNPVPVTPKPIYKKPVIKTPAPDLAVVAPATTSPSPTQNPGYYFFGVLIGLFMVVASGHGFYALARVVFQRKKMSEILLAELPEAQKTKNIVFRLLWLVGFLVFGGITYAGVRSQHSAGVAFWAAMLAFGAFGLAINFINYCILRRQKSGTFAGWQVGSLLKTEAIFTVAIILSSMVLAAQP